MGRGIGDGAGIGHLRAAAVTWVLIGVCLAVFLLPLEPDRLAFVPAWPWRRPEVGLRLVGHLFLHVDGWHLAGNLLALAAFGPRVEAALGHGRFLAFFLLCGLAGALTETGLAADPEVPLLGASGAIAGVMGGFLVLRPRGRISLPGLRLSAALVVAVEVLGNLALALDPELAARAAGLGGVAWWAHLGGFAAGLALVGPLRRPGVPLLDFSAEAPVPRRGWAMVAVKAAAFAALIYVLLRMA